MSSAGAEVETINLREKTIKDCLGCFSCWTKTPGTCIHKDDMTEELFPKWMAADVVVYATPFYNYAMAGTLKRFIERTIPSFLPYFEIHAGRMYHPLRHKVPAVVMLSVAGMPDKGQFEPLSAHIRLLCDSPGRKLLAEIYRPASEVMKMPFMQEKVNEVLSATQTAGRELVESLEISGKTLETITQPLADEHFFMDIARVLWNTCIAEGVALKEFTEKNMVPRSESIEDFLLTFPLAINAKAVSDRKISLQFKFSGEVQEPCFFTFDKGDIKAHIGTCDSSDLTIETPFNVWMDVMTGKADGQQMFMEQKYSISGELSLIPQIFPI
jgi:multimeric flavodoxin WrbA